jgi:hypothetical protein
MEARLAEAKGGIIMPKIVAIGISILMVLLMLAAAVGC